MARNSRRLSRRNITWLWIISVSIVIFVLIYWEQTALLYVLATFGVSTLLIVVALADLSGSRQITATPGAEPDDAAAIGSGIKTPGPSAAKTTFGSGSGKRGSS